MSRRQEQVALNVASDEDADGIGVVYGERSRKRKSAQGFSYKFGFVTVLVLLLVAVFGVGFFAGNFYQEPEPDAAMNEHYGKDRHRAMNYAPPGMHNDYGRSRSASAAAAGAFPGNGGNGNAQNVRQAGCADRRCCVGVEGVVGSGQCNGFIDIASCEENADRCEWDCDAQRGGRKRVRKHGHRRKYKGKGDRSGKFDDSQGLLADPPSQGHAKSWKEYQDAENAVELDECGDEFEDVVDDEQAQEEFNELGGTPVRAEDSSLTAPVRRRMKIIGANDQDRITWNTAEESVIGLLTFTSNGGTYWCTASRISKKHVITAGHCCADDGAWFSNWKWYPGARTYAERDSITPTGTTNRWTFTNWFSHSSYDYDMCVITLDASSSSYLGYGSNSGITTAWTFDYSGYPVSLADATGIKWGDDACPLTVVADGQLKYTCDTAGGQSGMSLYKTGTYIVYCIHSWGSTVQNGCARFDDAKFNAVKDHIVAEGGYT